MANTVLFFVGIPGCGKSTHARKLIGENPGKWKRVNKDDIRNMIDDGHWSKRNEQFVLETQDRIVSEALRQGFSVIVDNTHTHPKHEAHMRDIAAKYGADFEVKFFKVPLDVCIRRDSLREGKARVGKAVVTRMYNELAHLYNDDSIPWLTEEETSDGPPLYQHQDGLPWALVYDIDGTVAEMVNRGPFDWMRVHEDAPHNDVIEIVRWAKAHDYTVLAVSGRDAVCRELTENWLAANDVPFDALLMRPEGDSRKDFLVKEEIYREHIFGKYNILGVLDDRDQVVRHIRKLGVRVLQVAPGNF